MTPPAAEPEDLTVTVNGCHNTGLVRLRGISFPLDSELGAAFVTDCARNIEGLIADQDIKGKWGLDDGAWSDLGCNKPLLDAVRLERERRIHNNEAAREAAQRHLVKAPAVLGGILTDETVAPRHRIEAAKELRQAAGAEADEAGAKETFVIHIDLGADCVEHHEFERPLINSVESDSEA